MKNKFKFFTEKQRSFFVRKTIKKGGFYSFPEGGFTFYAIPSFDKNVSDYISTNPFTRSLAGQFFDVYEITENGFCKGNFSSGKKGPDFYLWKGDLEMKALPHMLFLFISCSIPFILYNLYVHLFNKNEHMSDLCPHHFKAEEIMNLKSNPKCVYCGAFFDDCKLLHK